MFRELAVVVLLAWGVAAQLYIDPNTIYNPGRPVWVVLDRDNYTRVLVREDTNVQLNCSFVRNSFIAENEINSTSSVSVQWLFGLESVGLDSIMMRRRLNDRDGGGSIRILNQFNEIVNITGTRLPSLAVDGNTGEYTCEVCSNREAAEELCVTSTIPVLGRHYPPDIDEGDPDETCPINPLFRFAQCKVGTNYCITMNNFPSTIVLECLHKPPPAPATPTPQQAIWFLNGVQITTNTGSQNTDTPSTVNINSVNKQLTIINSGGNAVRGNYTCMLTNYVGSDVATSIISDCEPPIIREGRRHSSSLIQIGFDPHCLTTPYTAITCEIQSGTPPIIFSWSRDGKLLAGQTSDRLVVNTPGLYTCNATNRIGMDSATSRVLVADFDVQIVGASGSGCERMNAPPPSITQHNVFCVFTNEQVSFNCSAAAQILGPGESNMPSQSTITVTNDVDGVYVCSSASECTNTAILRVFDLGEPPEIITDPSSGPSDVVTIGNSACINDSVLLNCSLSMGTEPVAYYWTKDGMALPNPYPKHLLRVNASGNYSCSVINSFGHDVATSVIRGLLTIDLITTVIGAADGAGCSRLNPRPSDVDICPFVWETVTFICRHDQVGTSSPPTILTPYGPAPSQFYINNCSRGVLDGHYSCSSSNECGTAASTIHLQVFDPARIDRRVRLPQSTVNITRVGAGRRHEPVRAIAGEHVELFCPSSGAEQPRTRWFKRGDDGSLNPVNPIPKYISTSMRTIQGITTAVLSFKGLRRNDFGEYICIAHNRAGRDEAKVLLREVGVWVTHEWLQCAYRRRVSCTGASSGQQLNDERCSEERPLSMYSCSGRY